MIDTDSSGLQKPATKQTAKPAGRHPAIAGNRALIGPGSVRLAGALLAGLLCTNPVATLRAEELVSFRCALAIDAVFAEMDKQAQNLVMQQALSSIDDVNGQLVCIQMDADEIQVRLQSTQMADNDNRLVFSLDAKTYSVRKVFYGR